MAKVDRFGVILGRLSPGDSLSVDHLARRLGVSEATVRRDLAELEGQGLLTRTHGGAIARDPTFELPVRYRSGRQSEEKRRIGAVAAALVPDGSVVGISGGTTTTEAARALAVRSGLTVVTNALNIAAELAPRPSLRLIVTGGLVRAASFELVGPVAEQTVGQYNLDVLLLGVDGIEAKLGCTTHDVIEARTNAAMVAQARRVVVVADVTKAGRIALAGICAVGDIDVLVTDDPVAGGASGADLSAAEGELARLAEVGVDVRRV